MSFQTTKLKNNKVYVGEFTQKNGDYKGWFIGSFLPNDHPCKTRQLEVMYFEHEKGFKQSLHYHQHKVEIVMMIEGKAVYAINGQEHHLNAGDFFFADVNNVIEGIYLEDSKVIVIHSPSIVKDKVAVK